MPDDTPPGHRVTFLPSGRSCELSGGETLLKAAQNLGLHINASCGGSGVCGKCRVLIKSGAVTGGINEKLSDPDRAAGWRQACTALVCGQVTVEIPTGSSKIGGGLSTGVAMRNRSRLRQYDLEELRRARLLQPPVEKLFLELPRPSPLDNTADAKRVIQGLHSQYEERALVVSLSVLRKLRRVLREDDFRVTVSLARPVHPQRGKNFLVNIQAGNWTKRSFGLVFDIGTTTIYGQLIDLNSGEIMGGEGDYNESVEKLTFENTIEYGRIDSFAAHTVALRFI